MYKKCQPYFSKPIEVILALDDELRRNTLEYLVRELVNNEHRELAISQLVQRLTPDRSVRPDDFDDDDDYFTEILDLSTDDALAQVISLLRLQP
jgi:hypothetical protein